MSDEHRVPKRLMAVPAVLTAALLLVTTLSASSSAAAPEAGSAASRPATAPVAPKPTIVLVHGAFADASSWNGVVTRLIRAGYPVIAPANPLRDLTGDADYISSVIASIPGPVVLVGHSYGGAVITNAANGHPNVKALVYIAAFAPDQGETALALTGQFPGSQLGANLITRPFPLSDGTTGTDGYVNPAAFHQVFAADLPAATAARMAATQRPVSLAALLAPSGVPAWKTVPSWYEVAGADQAIPAAAEEFMAHRAGSHTIVVKGASHVVMISHPSRTAELIIEAARATG